MKRAISLALVLCSVGCNRQQGYSHSPKEFTALDRAAIARVRRMPLSNDVILRSIAAEITEETSPNLAPCEEADFEVVKAIRRDLGKVEGTYLEETHVICRTLADKPSERVMLRFEWVFNSDLSSLTGFKFGVDPSEYPPDKGNE